MDGGARHVVKYGSILAGDARLRICGRDKYIQQKQQEKVQKFEEKLRKDNIYRLQVTSRAAVKWQKKWQESVARQKRLYSYWMEEMLNWHKTGETMYIPTIDIN